MRPFYSVFSICLAFLLTTSCGGRKGDSSSTDATTVDVAKFDQTLYTPEYASGFSITGSGEGSSSLLTVSDPWQGAEGVSSQLFISRDNEEPPADFSGQILKGDAKRIVTMSSTHVAMLDALGMADRIVGVSGLDFITNPYIHSRNDIGDVGYDGNINYEVLLSLNPDLVLLYGVTGASSMESKLKELGIPYIYIGDYLEESPLGKAEWMVALAEIVGSREVGERRFKEIPERYEQLKSRVKRVASESDCPKVMLNIPYGDSWFMPPTGSYMVRLISDAGGEYLYRENTGSSSLPIDMEKAYHLTSEADVWLNTGSVKSLEELRHACPKFSDTQVFRKGMVYNNNRGATPGGGNDFFESGIVRPDIVLRDLVKIFYPELVTEDFVYYRKLD